MEYKDLEHARSYRGELEAEAEADAEALRQRRGIPGRRTLTMNLANRAKETPGSRAPGKRTLSMSLLMRPAAPFAPAAAIQRKPGGASAQPKEADELRVLLEPVGGGRPLPEALRRKMEQVLGADLSAVRIHEGPQAAAVGALAFTRGTDIFFAPGQYDPESQLGQELLGHELAHVVQQAQGRVRPTKQSGGVPIDESGALEREADELGVKAAAAPAPAPAPAASSRGPETSLQGASGETLQLQPNKQEKKQAAEIAKELQALIDGAVWKEIRKTAYPKESAAGVQRAKERKDGKRPDLTGLGKLTTLESFAAAIKDLQKRWSKLSSAERVKEIAKAINDEMVTADVPPFIQVRPVKTEFKGAFSPPGWEFNISKAMVDKSPLSDADAAELCNTALHEARHAEQQFLSARYAAGPPKNHDAATISAEQGIPETPVAKKAVAKKFDAATDPTVAALGSEMYKANVTDGTTNQQISDDDYLSEMKDKRDEARKALAKLKSSINAKTIAVATAKRDELKAAIEEVKRRYTLYRNIPYEADAHEVGDAAEQAFKGWP